MRIRTDTIGNSYHWIPSEVMRGHQRPLELCLVCHASAHQNAVIHHTTPAIQLDANSSLPPCMHVHAMNFLSQGEACGGEERGSTELPDDLGDNTLHLVGDVSVTAAAHALRKCAVNTGAAYKCTVNHKGRHSPIQHVLLSVLTRRPLICRDVEKSCECAHIAAQALSHNIFRCWQPVGC